MKVKKHKRIQCLTNISIKISKKIPRLLRYYIHEYTHMYDR